MTPRLPTRLVAAAALLVFLPLARCQQRAASAPSSAETQVEQRWFPYDDYANAPLDYDATGWPSAHDQLPSAERAPPDWPSRGLLEQLLQRPAGGQADVSSLISALMAPAGGANGGAPAALAALLTRPTAATSTTARPTRIFDRFVIRDGNPFATMRPKRPATAAHATTAAPAAPAAPADSEVDKFDAGFQIFSQMFGGGNALAGLSADAFADAPTPAPPPPITATTAAAAAMQLGWPFYTTPTRGTTPRPAPTRRPVDKVDRPPPRPTVPYYYNVHQTPAPAPATPAPQVNLAVLLGSVTRLVKSDGPSMLAALGDAVTYIQDGNIMGLLQGVVPVFSRATPLFMNMISAVAPVLERSDLLGGAAARRPAALVASLLDGRRRPPRRRPANRLASAFSGPYHMGQVMGSALKMVTYLINHGTTVVRARQPGHDDDAGWLRRVVGADNAEFLLRWMQEQLSSAAADGTL